MDLEGIINSNGLQFRGEREDGREERMIRSDGTVALIARRI